MFVITLQNFLSDCPPEKSRHSKTLRSSEMTFFVLKMELQKVVIYHTNTITTATNLEYLVCMYNLLSIILKIQKVNPQNCNQSVSPAKAKTAPKRAGLYLVDGFLRKCITIFILCTHVYPNALYLSLSLHPPPPPSLPPTHLQAN